MPKNAGVQLRLAAPSLCHTHSHSDQGPKVKTESIQARLGHFRVAMQPAGSTPLAPPSQRGILVRFEVPEK